MKAASVTTSRKIQLCSELGLDWEKDPCEGYVGTALLGSPSLNEDYERSDGWGQCIFSSIFYLLTGTESSKLLTLNKRKTNFLKDGFLFFV